MCYTNNIIRQRTLYLGNKYMLLQIKDKINQKYRKIFKMSRGSSIWHSNMNVNKTILPKTLPAMCQEIALIQGQSNPNSYQSFFEQNTCYSVQQYNSKYRRKKNLGNTQLESLSNQMAQLYHTSQV